MTGRLINSFAWDFLGRAGSQVVNLITGIILARLLTPSEFGLIGMAIVFISMSEIFVHLGLSSALIQKLNPTEEHYSSSFFMNMGMALFLTILFFISAPLIANFFKNEQLVDLIRVLSFGFLINGAAIVQETQLNKHMKFGLLTKIKLWSFILGGIIGITLAFKGFGVWSLVVQHMVVGFFRTTLLWFRTRWRPKLLFNIKAIKDLWGFGFNLFLSNTIGTIYNQLDTLIIAKLFSTTELGLFSKAKSLNRTVISYSSQSIGSVTFPAMVKINNDPKLMHELGMKSEKLIAFVSFALFGWLFVSAESLILLLYGPKWIDTVPIFRLLCLSGLFNPISTATLSMLKAHGDSKSYLKVQLWKKLIGLTGMGVGFIFGLKGYLISLIITEAISVFLNMLVTGKSLTIPVKNQLIPLLPYTSLAFMSVIAIEAVHINFTLIIYNLLLLSSAYLILYFGSNLLLRTDGFALFIRQLRNLYKALNMRIFSNN